MKRIHFAGIAGLLAVAFVFWWFSPTQVLKRRSASLVESLSFKRDTGIPLRQLSGYSFGSFLADEVELDSHGIPEAEGTFSRSNLESAHTALASYARESGFEIERFHAVTVTGDLAHVSLTIDGFVQLPEFRPADGKYLVDLHWRCDDGVWRLYRAVWREAR